MGIIISENLVECVKMSEENSEDSQALINEAVELLIKVNDNITTIIVMLVIGILGGFISGLVGIGEPLLFTRLSYYYHHYLVYLLIVLILLQD